MKKLKAFIAVLICVAFLPALPVVRSAAYDGEIYINDREACCATLGITDDKLTELVDYLYDSVATCRPILLISSYNIPFNDDTITLLSDLLIDNPKSFNVDTQNVRFGYLGDNFYSIFMSYFYGADEYNRQLAECDAVAAELTAGITLDIPDAIRVALVHDRLAGHCKYSTDFNESTQRYDNYDYTAYGALINRKAICQGYSHAFAYLLNYIGIRNYYCPSDALNHVWNIVFVDGEKYHVDVTWDDPTFDVPGRLKHWSLVSSTNKILSPSAATARDAHNASDYDSSPVSTLYDNAFWNTSQTQLCLLNGLIYYVNNDEKRIYSYNYKTGAKQMVSDLGGVFWPAGSGGAYWTSCYTRLDSDGQYLYLSLPDGIRRFDPIANYAEDVFLPNMPRDYYVYGFELTGRTITCLAATSPNIDSGSPKEFYTYTIPGERYSAPVVTGVAQNGTYSAPVTISWDIGIGTLDGAIFLNGDSVTSKGNHTLVVTNGDKSVTIGFTVTAEKPPVKKGDFDSDGAITVGDALSALRIAARIVQSSPELVAVGDIDGDGVISVGDALSILRVAARLVPSL